MLGFKPEVSARITLAGIALVHMMCKQQGLFAHIPGFFMYHASRQHQPAALTAPINALRCF